MSRCKCDHVANPWHLGRARECALMEEFSLGYRNFRREGCDVFEAAWSALNDWDVLDVEQLLGDWP